MLDGKTPDLIAPERVMVPMTPSMYHRIKRAIPHGLQGLVLQHIIESHIDEIEEMKLAEINEIRDTQ